MMWSMRADVTRSDDQRLRPKPARWPRRPLDPSGAPTWTHYILWTVLKYPNSRSWTANSGAVIYHMQHDHVGLASRKSSQDSSPILLRSGIDGRYCTGYLLAMRAAAWYIRRRTADGDGFPLLAGILLRILTTILRTSPAVNANMQADPGTAVHP